MVMARTQTLVQLSDDLLAQLDSRAAREGRSRSDLIREAIAGYLGADREAEVDRLIVEAYIRQPQKPDELAFADLGMQTMLANVESWDDEPVTDA
jgi:metal-responsive CopG/Arc/MetJ family transcriptional regulator